MTPRRLAAAFALAVLAGSAPAVSAAPSATLTITGTRSAYADVTFPTRVRLGTSGFERNAPHVSGKGTFAGAYLTPLSGDGPSAGTLLMRGLPVWDDYALPLGTADWLPAGRYRVHLLGDGPTTVRLPAEGLRRGMTVRPTQRSAVVSKLVHRRAVPGTDAPADRTVIPLSLRTTTLTVLAAAQEASGPVGHTRICLHAPGKETTPCDVGGGSGRDVTKYGSTGRYGLGMSMAFYPGDAPAGDVEAEYVDVAAGVSHGMYAFALTLN